MEARKPIPFKVIEYRIEALNFFTEIRSYTWGSPKNYKVLKFEKHGQPFVVEILPLIELQSPNIRAQNYGIHLF